MSREGKKLRQTCDTCRKSKVKCNKQLPVCGRCLASGAPCNYGISNRGGRKYNWEGFGINNEVAESATAYRSHSSPADTTNPESSPEFPDSAFDVNSWERLLNVDGFVEGPFDTTMPSTSSTSPQTSSTLSLSSGRSPTSLAEFDDSSERKQQSELPCKDGAPIHKRANPCSCLITILQMLQTLHQNFQQNPNSLESPISILTYDSVLSIIEDATTSCRAMLRCSFCSRGDAGDSFTILASLLRRVLSLIEVWVAVPALSDSHTAQWRRSVTASWVAQQDGDSGLKAQISIIGIKKLEEVVAELKRAGQELRSDYERLTCVSLTVNLSAQLKSALERLGCL